jgi:hypothetical protein
MSTNPPSSPNKKPFGVSHTKMATFRRCLQQYHWKYINGFFPPSSIGQARGTAGHAALASWHVNYDADLALDTAWATWEANAGTQGSDWDLLDASLRRYFDWSLNNKDDFKIIQAEQEFQIEFEVPAYTVTHNRGKIDAHTSTHSSFILTGFIDGIVEEKGQLWLLENKFYKKMDNTPLDLDAQVSMYMLASTLLGYDVHGVIYNIVRVADTKVAVTEPVVRRRLHRNTEGLRRIQDEMVAQVGRMISYHQEEGPTYRSPTKDCHWDCPFYSACLLMTDDGNPPTQQLISLSQIRSKNAEEETNITAD